MARSKKAQEAINDALAAHIAEDQVGLGVDIVEVDRMRRILQRTPGFAARVFSQDERAYCDKAADPAMHYATRFAAKEAVVKALGTGFASGIGVRDIEVLRAKNGRPAVKLYGRAKEVADDIGVTEIPISLSHTRSDAIACAIAITRGATKAAAERKDPIEELAAQFKEVRGMLDEIGTSEPSNINSANSANSNTDRTDDAVTNIETAEGTEDAD